MELLKTKVLIGLEKRSFLKKTILVTSFLAVSLAGTALAQENNYGNCPMGGMMYGFSGGYGGGAMLFSWLFGLLFTTALVLLIVWLVKQISQK